MDSEEGNDHAVEFLLGEEEEDGDEEVYGYKSKKIKPSEYEGANVEQVVRSCSHLSLDKQNDLQAVLNKYPKLCNAKLGVYPKEKIHLDLDANVEPHRTRSYTVPRNHQEVFKAELDRLVWLGIL